MGSLAIVAAVDGGASVSGRWTEEKVMKGREGRADCRQAGLASRNDDDDDGREGGKERRNKKLQMNSLAGQRYDHLTRASYL